MASKSLAILVIDENRIRASIIEAGLRETGHDNFTIVHDINWIARTIADINPDVRAALSAQPAGQKRHSGKRSSYAGGAPEIVGRRFSKTIQT